MAYLDNTAVEIDAILTKRGRELLSKGAQYFKITQFACADDEIDYRLWNPDHSLGSNYYGELIENMPILEAIPDERQMCKYKLVTLPKNTVRMPIISLALTGNLTLEAGQTLSISPKTINYVGGNATFGYTAILSDGDIADLRIAAGGELNVSGLPTIPLYSGEGLGESITVMGNKFEIVAKNQFLQDRTATITIIGNETGGRATITITVKQVTTPTIDTISNTRLYSTYRNL